MDRLVPFTSREEISKASKTSEGKLKNALEKNKYAVQDMEYHRFLCSKPEFFKEKILESGLNKIFTEMFVGNAEFCNVRARADQHIFNGRDSKNLGVCYNNAMQVSLDTGMKLYSGYAYGMANNELYWHVWNVDHQDFVYDSSDSWSDKLLETVYFGINLDPHIITQAQELLRKNENLEDSKRLTSITIDTILHMRLMNELYSKAKKQLKDVKKEEIDIFFKDFIEMILKHTLADIKK